MKAPRRPRRTGSQSPRVQLALLGHMYRLEVLELCQLAGLWLLDIAEAVHVGMHQIDHYARMRRQR